MLDVMQKLYPHLPIKKCVKLYQTVPANSSLWIAYKDPNCDNGWHANKMIMVNIAYIKDDEIIFIRPLCYMVNGALPGSVGTIVRYYNAQPPYLPAPITKNTSLPTLVKVLNTIGNYSGRPERTGQKYQEPPKTERAMRYKQKRGHDALPVNPNIDQITPRRKSKINGHQQNKKKATTSRKKKRSDKEEMDKDTDDSDNDD